MEKDGAQRPERSYRKAAVRRAEILTRAIELFAERGVGASLRAIGGAAGGVGAAAVGLPRVFFIPAALALLAVAGLAVMDRATAREE